MIEIASKPKTGVMNKILRPAPPATQQVIVIPQNMLVNGCLAAKDLKTILNNSGVSASNIANVTTANPANKVLIQKAAAPGMVPPTIKITENRPSLKRPLASPNHHINSDSCYSSDDSENGDFVPAAKSIKTESVDMDMEEKPVRKRANLDHLSPEEKLMRRKLKNRVAAQNARDKKRVHMEKIEDELERLRAHAKTLEAKNAELVEANRRLQAENDRLTGVNMTHDRDVASPLVVPSRPSESAELNHDPQQQVQGRLMAGGLTTASRSSTTSATPSASSRTRRGSSAKSAGELKSAALLLYTCMRMLKSNQNSNSSNSNRLPLKKRRPRRLT